MSDINVQTFSGKVNVANNLKVGSSHFFVDTQNNNVGIGTNNPTHTLDVHGTANVGVLTATFLHGDGSNIQNIVSSQWQGTSGDPIYYSNSVGIATTTAPTRTLEVGSNLYVEDTGSNVLVVDGNVAATSITIGDATIVASQGLDHVTNENNTTTQVVQFNNPTTGFVTASNAVIGGTLSLQNFALSQSYGLENVTGVNNTTGDTIVSSNATTGFQSTANVSVGRDALVTGNVTVGKDLTVSEEATFSSNVTIAEDLEVSGNVTNLDVLSNVNLLSVSNVVSIRRDSNVVTEFSRSKKLIKYPRVALTSASQDGYVVTASSTLSTGTPANVPYTVFDESLTTFWHPQYPYYNTSNGSYAPGQTALGTGTPANGTTLPTNELVSGHQGEWISIELPNKIKLDRLKVTGSTRLASGITQFPKDVVVAVSDTGLSGSWSVLQTATLTSRNVSNHSDTINITANTSYYKYFALIVKSINSTATYSATEIGQLELFGVPEYDPDADGVDVVVKSEANVPNTDWLELYYDAKDLTGVPSTVLDMSGNSRNGTATNVTVSDGAFNFTGAYTSNVTTSDHGLGTGDVVYTVSYWFKRIRQRNTYDYLYIAGNGGTTGQASLMWIYLNRLHLDHWGTATKYEEPIQNNRWYHVAAGHRGGPAVTNDFLFIDGQSVGVPVSSQQTFNLQGTKLTLGTSHNTTNEFLEGSIANFRLFNRALSQDEIYQLYAYQKEYFGHGNLNMTLKAGRLGIGTSEPRAALDVRGVIHGTSPATFIGQGNTGTNVTASATVLPIGNVIMDTAGSWNATTSRYYVKIPGIYFVSVSRVTIESTGVYVAIYIYVNGSTSTQVTFQGGSGSYPSGSLSTIVSVKEGDYIEIRASTDINYRVVGGYYDVRMIHMSM